MSEGLIKEPKNVELEHTLATRKGKKKKKKFQLQNSLNQRLICKLLGNKRIN